LLVVASGAALAALLAGDWWARQRDWDLRWRLAELAAARPWRESPSTHRARRVTARRTASRRRAAAIAALGDAARASHDVGLHRHFSLGPPQVVLTYGGHRLKVRLYHDTVWRLNARYRVKVLALQPDDAVGWRLAVYHPSAGRVAQLAWLVTAA
jgi:hypothetical protein